MADKQIGGWYDNPAQGGKNMRWWGENNWTMGEDPGSAPATTNILGGTVGSSNRMSSQDMFANLSEKYGLGELKNTAKSLSEQIYKIEDYLKNVEGDVQQRAGNFDMNEAQQRRLMASESEPSRKSLAELSTSYGRTTSNIASITGDINTQLSLAMADQQYQDSIRTAAANVGVVITGNESTEDLLAAIAGKVS